METKSKDLYDIMPIPVKEDENEVDVHEECMKLLTDKNILDLIDAEFDKKIVGEQQSRKTIFMVANMRNVENLNKGTDNLMINANSGTGKDYITEAVFEIIPDCEKEELQRTTPKVLAYTRNKKLDKLATWKKTALRLEDVSNSVLNDDSFKVISTASPNKLNHAKTIIKGKVVEIGIEGKPTILITMADAFPKEEMLRRFPVCNLDEGVEQTREIIKRQAEYAKVGKSTDYNPIVKESLKILKRVKVKVPFADLLKNIFPPESMIVRTSFTRFIDYIKSSCALHQYQRKNDEEGYYLAEKQDYEIAREMMLKTNSNAFMIPITRILSAILKAFEDRKGGPFYPIDEIIDWDEIDTLNISERWLRVQINWLVSKGFLIKAIQKLRDSNGDELPIKKAIYGASDIKKLSIPLWDDLNKHNSVTSISSTTSVTSVASTTS